MELFVVLSAALSLALAGAKFDSADNSISFQSIIAECLDSNNTVTCLSIKGITALNRAAQSEKKFEILPGVSIRRYECDFYLFFECSLCTFHSDQSQSVYGKSNVGY